MEWITVPDATLKKEWQASEMKMDKLIRQLVDEYDRYEFLQRIFLRKKMLTEAIQRSIQHRAVTNK